MNDPKPNDKLTIEGDDYTVVATCYYTDDIMLVLLLAAHPPYFAVAHIDLETGNTMWINVHRNIVPAVEEYIQSGGDY